MTVIPVEKDVVDGPVPIEILARVAAQLGEPDRAIAALQKLLSIPYAAHWLRTCRLLLRYFRLDPMFDPLRNDPRFEKLILEPTLKLAKAYSMLPSPALDSFASVMCELP